MAARRKSRAEARTERITWFLLVMIFALMNLFPEAKLPNPLIPFAGATILLGSGLYQYFRKWRVSFVTWIAGTTLLIMGIYNVYSRPDLNLTGFSLIVFAIVILFGIITNET